MRIPSPVRHAPVMHGNGRINQIAPESPEPRQCAILVHAGKPAVADNIRRKNSREFPGLGHDVPPATTPDYHKDTFRTGLNRAYRGRHMAKKALANSEPRARNPGRMVNAAKCCGF